MKVVVGEPGSGKSTRLILRAIELVRAGKSVFIVTPSHKAKERLISEFKDRLLNRSDADRAVCFELLRSTHVTIKNYHGEINILIDELSMIDLTDFYALLYQTLPDGVERNIEGYGDIKQNPAVNARGTLETLLRANEGRFKQIKNDGFWSWVDSNCYGGMEPGRLIIPELWRQAIKSIEIEALNTNYRLLKWGDGSIDSFGDLFYSELFRDHTSTDYQRELVECIEDDWLILSPTYTRGNQCNQIISDYYGEKYEQVAPFFRRKKHEKDVYLNPKNKRFNELKTVFNFLTPFDERKNIDDFEPTCFLSVHSVQGGEVQRCCFYVGDDDIPQQKREFYNKNLMYTALTRAGNDWKLLGKLGSFLEMKNTEVQDPHYITNDLANTEALSTTMQTIVNLGGDETLTPEEIYQMFEDNFRRLKKILKSEKGEPFKISRVMKEFDTKSKWYYQLPSAYGFFYASWALKQQADGKSKGGKNSSNKGRGKNQLKYDALSDEKKATIANDISNRKYSKAKFERHYGMTKRQARKLNIKE